MSMPTIYFKIEKYRSSYLCYFSRDLVYNHFSAIESLIVEIPEDAWFLEWKVLRAKKKLYKRLKKMYEVQQQIQTLNDKFSGPVSEELLYKQAFNKKMENLVK